MKSRTLALWGLLAIVIAMSAFYTLFDRVAYTSWRGPEGEARVNAYLPIELALQALGVDADSRETISLSDSAIGPNDAMVVKLSSQFVPVSARQRVEDWVRSGGHLVLDITYMPYDSSADWIESFGFVVEDMHERSHELTDTDIDAPHDPPWPGEDYLTFHRLVPFDDTVEMKVRSDELGAYAVQFPFGEGHITLLAGDAITFYYWQFADESSDVEFIEETFRPSVALMADIVAGSVSSEKIWFVYSGEFPSLWDLLMRRAPHALAAASVLLLLSLWAAIRRFGPMVSDTAAPRRSIMEHIQATARFAWRHRGLNALSDEAINATLQAAERRDPGIHLRPTEERAARIGRLTGQSTQAIADAMNPGTHEKPSEFVEAISTLQKIRNQL